MSPVSTVDKVTPAGPPKSNTSFVRYILLALVVLSLLFSVVFSTIGIVVLEKIGSSMTELQQAAVWFHVLVYIIFAVCCLIGIYACTLKKRSSASLFTSVVLGEVLFCIGSGVWCLYYLFDTTSSQAWDVDKCLSAASDQFTKELCSKTDLLKGFTVAMFVIVWLVQIVIIFLGNSFLSSLRKAAIRSGELVPKYDRDGDDWC